MNLERLKGLPARPSESLISDKSSLGTECVFQVSRGPNKCDIFTRLARSNFGVLVRLWHQAYVLRSIADMPGIGGSADTDLRLGSEPRRTVLDPQPPS